MHRVQAYTNTGCMPGGLTPTITSALGTTRMRPKPLTVLWAWRPSRKKTEFPGWLLATAPAAAMVTQRGSRRPP